MNLSAAFDWYSSLAQKPGWAFYVRDRALELAAEHPAEFKKLPLMLAAEFPWLTQCRMERANETRANTYRLEASRFVIPQPVKGKR